MPRHAGHTANEQEKGIRVRESLLSEHALLLCHIIICRLFLYVVT